VNQPDIRPNRQNWRQFCQELELTTDDEATWREMAAAINETDGNALSDYIAAATATEEAEYLATSEVVTYDWSDLVQTADARRRYERAELRAWARWQEQEQAR